MTNPIMTSIPQTDPEPGKLQLNVNPTARMAYILLALLLISNGPLFLCMPLTNDVAMYDIQARTMLAGGVLYRDVLEPNLPGVVWVQASVRTLFGDSSVVLRAFDLLVLATTIGLIGIWLHRSGCTSATIAWSAVFVVPFYFSISEWSHCQRDIWLLAPALAGLVLRGKQVVRMRGNNCSQ